ncbi:metallophosphoesterase [Mucilaginibacter sp.]|jgi:predicted phosphodiesterase|uniref:metallophosphoesterase n=1 Tax=Mucilaginibacter sp. TaxID=1882438 RepID=UPI002B51DBD3|nr:metallophosphoesterase [Mucilaginibacter sp.]HTI58470.1 metallophosphoesterase [Mucilaginibacter sp.]
MINLKKNLVPCIALLLCATLLWACKNCGCGYEKCLIVSDIHLQLDNDSTGYSKDPSLGLVQAVVKKMHEVLPAPKFIIIAGDFVGHEVHDGQKAAIIDKVAQVFHATFDSKIPIIPVFGNNDSDGGDYVKQSPAFLSAFARSWNLSTIGVDTAEFVKTGGYYATSIKGDNFPNMNFIALNSTLVSDNSHRYKGKDSLVTYKDGVSMLQWLNSSLSRDSTKKSWIIYHMPPGDDTYKIVANQSKPADKRRTDTLMWSAGYTTTFDSIMAVNSSHIAFGIAGHTHRNSFLVFSNVAGTPVAYTRVVSSVSPNYGNNPSFEVADFDPKTGQVTGEKTYALNIANVKTSADLAVATWTNKYSINTVAGLQKVNSNTLYDFAKKNNSDTSMLDSKFIYFYNSGARSSDPNNLTLNNYPIYFQNSLMQAK